MGAKPSGALVVRDLIPFRFERRQAEAGARLVAIDILFAVFPGSIEFAAGTGALLVNRALHVTAHFTDQRRTPRRFAVGAVHRYPTGTDLRHQFIGHRTAGGGAFTPEKRHAKMGTAGTAIQTRTDFGHGEGIKGVDRRIRTDPAAILGFAMNLGRGARKYFFVAGFCRKTPGLWAIAELSRAYVSLQCHGSLSG